MILNMTSHREAMQAILDTPDADSPRLAYAVACEANGDSERGQFIRLQLEAAFRARAGRDDWWEPASQARDLREATSHEWAGPIHTRVARYDFYRGFVEMIQLDAKDFLSQADELYQLAPIRRLSLQGVAPVADELFKSPYLSRIVSLSLSHQKLGDRGVELLAASPYLGKLVSLDLAGNDIMIAGIEAMATSSKLPSLKKVELIGNPAASVSEIVAVDGMDGRTMFPRGSEEGWKLEQRYGRKTWLHTVEDHGRRELMETEL